MYDEPSMSDSTTSKTIEELETELVGIKVRLRRIEDFIQTIPAPEEYIQEGDNDDNLIDEALNVLRDHEFASASLLQRNLQIGYARAARLIDLLEERGIVGEADGSKPRKVLINMEESKIH